MTPSSTSPDPGTDPDETAPDEDPSGTPAPDQTGTLRDDQRTGEEQARKNREEDPPA